jgi:DNA-binding response OmpR family regulator
MTCNQAIQSARTAGARAHRHAALDSDAGYRYVFVRGFEDRSKMELHRNGALVQLTAQEFKVLKFMIQNSERVLSREELLNHVWGYKNYPSTRTVDNHILKLRQKLERDPANPIHFRTVHSAGYKFVP